MISISYSMSNAINNDGYNFMHISKSQFTKQTQKNVIFWSNLGDIHVNEFGNSLWIYYRKNINKIM